MRSLDKDNVSDAADAIVCKDSELPSVVVLFPAALCIDKEDRLFWQYGSCRRFLHFSSARYKTAVVTATVAAAVQIADAAAATAANAVAFVFTSQLNSRQSWDNPSSGSRYSEARLKRGQSSGPR